MLTSALAIMVKMFEWWHLNIQAVEVIDMTEEAVSAYEQKFNAVLHYIEVHLYDSLTVDVLAQISCFSKYHFHRQFSAYVGIGVYQYVQLLRLKRASYQLAFRKDQQIIDIAFDAGFENPESLSRAFKKAFGQTPSQFRNEPAWEPWHKKYIFPEREGVIDMQVDVVSFPETRIAVMEHRKSPDLVNESVAQLISWRKETGLSPIKTSDTYGVAYDDPKVVSSDNFRFDLCASVQNDVPENRYGIVNKIIPTGKCARLRHLGSHASLSQKVYFLYREWLPESGEELRDFPCFFQYIQRMPDVLEHEQVTDVFLPLR